MIIKSFYRLKKHPGVPWMFFIAAIKFIIFFRIVTTFLLFPLFVYAMLLVHLNDRSFVYMTKILFVCHGNICRSPMAESVMQHLVQQQKLSSDFFISSAATSREELGNPVHPGTQKKLEQAGIPKNHHRAVQMQKSDYDRYDYLIGMDDWNLKNMMRIVGKDPLHKLYKLLDFTKQGGNIADPWYTGDFDKTYQDILTGCHALLNFLLHKTS